VALPRRRVLAGLAGLPLALAACTTRGPRSQQSTPPPPAGGSPTTSAAPTQPAAVDAPALEAAAADALALLATYEATVALHPSLGPALAASAADHDAHLDVLAERITLPNTTSSPATSGPTGRPQTGPTSTGPLVPADPVAARAAVVQAEAVTGEAARDAAGKAHDGEAARLLASIGTSRAVHALLLGASA